ncbi:uncharacterized protein UDID_08071 [Ustilago sp. UG-2017a]|nr:uncharacterized protein UDID_08071 [Ustilago sp. UG-2017a]
MSYPQHPSPAGGPQYMAPSPGVIRSQNLPFLPSQPHQMPPSGQYPHPQPGFPSHQQQPYPVNPNEHRPIASLPLHARHMPAPQTPPSRPQPGAARPHTAMSMLQQRAGSARGPHALADPSASFKRPKMVGDGYEAPYLLPGPSNRILLSLKSGLPNQIDWALSRLVLLTANHRDQAARDFTFDSVPGLADVLLSYVRRIHAALTGEHPSKWDASFFEQPSEAPDVGIGAPGDAGHQGTSTRQSIPTKPSSDLTLAKLTSPSSDSILSFNPSHDPSHVVLMRRALEAALALRNLATYSSNARSLASIKGIYALIRDVLQLPSTAVQILADAQQSQTDSGSVHEDGWLEIEGIAELRLYFLDILETLAPRLTLTRRATSGASAISASTTLNGHETALTTPKAVNEDATSPADVIFATLLSLALHTNDRSFLIGSLRCLTTLAANERNEAAFVEVTLPNGQQSPGLLQRCVELLPLTQDTDLLEAALDLLYQLVCIGNNAIKVATALNLEPLLPHSPASRGTKERNGSTDSHSANASNARATAKTAALVRLLSRNLQLGRSMWERSMPLKIPQQWLGSIPSRQVEAMRRQRELHFRIANETPQERSKRKRLTRQERQSLAGLQEPERGIAWMKLLFQRNPDKEVTQMEFWTAYKEEFQGDAVALQPAAELIRAVGVVFPQAAAMVVPKQDGQPQRFVIRGIDVKERDLDQLEPFRCRWSTCSSPATSTLEAQRGHAKLHAQYASDGRCRWKRCDYDAKSDKTASEEEQTQVLVAHVLTHIKSADAGRADAKRDGRPKVVVDDDLRVVSRAEHTGEAAKLITTKTANGARVLRGKRDPDGVEITFTIDKAVSGQNGVDANGASNGHLAPSNATPSSGTLDNPGTYMFDVTRTPSSGNDDNLSPQGPAFTSILILRMLARRAASLLHKAGSKRSNPSEDDEVAATIRGQGDEKFGLPLPANFSSSDRAKQGESGDGNAQDGVDAAGSMMGTEEEDYETTEAWAVEAATRLLDAVEGVEEDLLHHSSQNDILSSYINETLLELSRRPAASSSGEDSNGQVDPQVLRDEAFLL